MFEVEVVELDAEAALAAAARLRASADRAEADLLAVAAHYADLHPASATCWSGALPGMERGRVMGGEGCPEVGEFASVELGAALGVSSGAAASLMEDALALRHRLPRVWVHVQRGEVQAWRARKIAQSTRRLSRDAAAVADARVAPIAQSVTPYRLDLIVRAAIAEVDPDQAQAAADNEREGRGVWVGQSDLCGTKTVVIRAAAGDVVRLDATTDQIAECLARLGDTDSLDARRAKAIGWLARPQAALELWNAATAGLDHASPVPGADAVVGRSSAPAERRASDRAGSRRRERGLGNAVTLYVHLSDQTLSTGTGVLRGTAAASRISGRDEGAEGQRSTVTSDQLGPLLASQLAELVGHDRIIVKPVIDLRDRLSADAYEIPDRIREHVLLRYPTCVFPWCNRPAAPGSTGIDLDHVVPYDDTGPPGQTSTENLAPGCRLHHRVKTHGGWRCERLPDGAFEWTSPLGRRYRVDHTGTHPLDQDE